MDFVYHCTGGPELLASLAGHVGPQSHWAADLATFEIGAGLPSDWREEGSVFGDAGELRWWRRGEAEYEALLITAAAVAGLEPLPGDWEVEERDVVLQDLGSLEVSPAARSYPSGEPRGKMRARLYRRSGTTIFISPRGFLTDAERRDR